MKSLTLWLMRHGDASFQAPTDAQRPLSEQGQNEVNFMASELKKRHLDLSFIWVSPYLRAQQTWELIKPALLKAQADQNPEHQAALPVQALPALDVRLDAPITPCDDPKKVVKMLAAKTSGNGFLIAHQPLLGRLATYLDSGQVQDQALGTASVLALEMDCIAPGCALLKEHLFPR